MEDLAKYQKIYIQQNFELLEAVSCIETNNSYDVLDNARRVMYSAREETSFCLRCCFGKSRAFTMKITNPYGAEVAVVERKYTCTCCCFLFCNCMSCCKEEITVESPPGRLIGSINQTCNMCKAKYEIRDEYDRVQAIMISPSYMTLKCCNFCCCPFKFQILSPDEDREIGKLVRETPDTLGKAIESSVSDVDLFSLTFPSDMKTKTKIVLLAGVFLVDFMFFENDSSRKDVEKGNKSTALGMIDN